VLKIRGTDLEQICKYVKFKNHAFMTTSYRYRIQIFAGNLILLNLKKSAYITIILLIFITK